MEQTGGRVQELHLVTVDDFKDARDMIEPSLKMHTLKRKDEQTTRHVPIPHTLVTDIAQYMKYRRKIMKKKGLTEDKDHGFLFIATKTGEPFKAGSWYSGQLITHSFNVEFSNSIGDRSPMLV